MVCLQVFEHELEVVTDEHGDDYPVPICLILILLELGVVNFLLSLSSVLLLLSQIVCRVKLVVKDLGFESVFLEKGRLFGHEVEAGVPFGMQVNSCGVALCIWTGGQQYSKDANDYDLGDGLVCGHVPLVEHLYWVTRL